MFWTSSLPADVLSEEHPRLGAARADLAAATVWADVTSTWVCDAMHSIRGDWRAFSCGDSLPNTHWHLMARDDDTWAAWRVHKVRHTRSDHAENGLSRIGMWQDLTCDERAAQLVESVAVTPMAVSLPSLVHEITRHGHELGGSANPYPYGEVHALSMVLGMVHPEADDVRFMEALGGFPEARALAETRGGLHPAYKTARLLDHDLALF